MPVTVTTTAPAATVRAGTSRQRMPGTTGKTAGTATIGEITLAGVRGAAVADVIPRLSADSQLEADVSELFRPEPMKLHA